jgi:hypothetical protein
MNLMKFDYLSAVRNSSVVFFGAMVLHLSTAVGAQSSNGTTATTCSQSGTEVTCTTTIKYSLPAGITLQSGTVGSGNFVLAGGGPGCGSLNASPSSVAANTQTTVNLSISGCAQNATYTWASPAQTTATSSSVHSLTLATGAQPQQYSVEVCLPGQTASPGCQTYTTSVGLTAAVPSLAGCAISPSSSSITTTGSTTLSVSCTQGTGSGSGVQYQWRRNGVAVTGTTSHSVSGLTVGTYNYSVDISNNAPSTASPTAALQVTQAQATQCPSGISVPARTINVATAGYQTWSSANHPGTTPYVVAVDVPAGSSLPSDLLANLAFSPKSGPGAREVSVSRVACDFSSLFPLAGGTSINIGYDVNAAVPSPRGIILGEGRWFFNFRSPSGGSCDSQNITCAMNMQYGP